MRLVMTMLALIVGFAASANAQWTTVCVRYTTRIRTCSARYTAPPAPPRGTLTLAPEKARAPIAVDSVDEPRAVLGVWRATGVAFESHGIRTLLEVRVSAAPSGVHLVVPAAMGLAGGTAYDLAHVAPMLYRATDRAGRSTTFRVAGGRAELLVTGAGGGGLVTWQLDEHEPPKQ